MTAAAAARKSPRLISSRYAWYALGVLTLINLVNYLDRNVLAPVLDSVKASFSIDDQEAGLLTTAFFWVYTIASPISGYLGDRVSRRMLIVIGIALWSVATVSSAFATSYHQLWLCRAATGVGEAGYGIVAPAFLGDLFSKEKRSRTLSVFYLALPVGTAAGYAFGGYVGEHFGHGPGEPHAGLMCSLGIHEGWRYAFLFGGIPGLMLAALAAFLVEPKRGSQDGVVGHEIAVGKFQWSAVGSLLRTRSFVINVAATTAMTFAIGGLAQWAPTFVQRVHGYSKDQAGVWVGIVVAVTGTIGTFCGGFLADYARRWTNAAHFIVPGITLSLCSFALAGAFLVTDRASFWVFASISIFLLFCNSGPLNAAILNVSMPAVRATAFAITIFTIHLLGDALSPWVIGGLSDALVVHTPVPKWFGPAFADSPPFALVQLGWHASAHSLRYAFLIAPPIVLVGGILLLVFAKDLPRDVAEIDRKLRPT